MRPNFGTIPNYNLVSNYAKLNMERVNNDIITNKFDNAVTQSNTMNQGEFKEKNNTLHHTLSELFYQNDTEIPSMVPMENESENHKELEHIRDNMDVDKPVENKETFEKDGDDKKNNKLTKTVLFIIIILLITIVFAMYFVNNYKYQKMLMNTMDCNQFISV